MAGHLVPYSIRAKTAATRAAKRATGRFVPSLVTTAVDEPVAAVVSVPDDSDPSDAAVDAVADGRADV